jgi:hypothetical protein
MDNQQDSAEKAVAGLSKFKIMSANRAHSWYAWAAGGLTIGLLVTIAYVANNSARFDAGQAFEPELAGKLQGAEASALPERISDAASQYEREYGPIERVTLERAFIYREDGSESIAFGEPQDYLINAPLDWTRVAQSASLTLNSPDALEVTFSSQVMNPSPTAKPILFIGSVAQPAFDKAIASFPVIAGEEKKDAGTTEKELLCKCSSTTNFTISCPSGEVAAIYSQGDSPVDIVANGENEGGAIFRWGVNEKKNKCDSTGNAGCAKYCGGLTTPTIDQILDKKIKDATVKAAAKKQLAGCSVTTGDTTEKEGNGKCQEAAATSQ